MFPQRPIWPTLVSLIYATGRQEEADAKTLVCDKPDIAISCEFCRDLHLTTMFSGLYQKIHLKESNVWRNVTSNKIIVTLGTQGLRSSPALYSIGHFRVPKPSLSKPG